MTFLEQLIDKLAAVFILKDSLTSDIAFGDVFITADRGVVFTKYNPDCFVLLNANGSCQLTAGGHYYQTKTVTVDLTQVDVTTPIELVLSPRANYPYPAGLTIVRGKIQAAETAKPITGAILTVDNHPEQAISEEDGSYVLKFDTITADENLNINISKTGYQSQKIKVSIKYQIFNRLAIQLGPI